jgi:hypothetical protein
MQEHGEADEARIAALFRDAASGAPPPGFDAAQVVATSRRISRRRRSAVAGAALAVLAVVGVGVVAGLGGPSGTTVTAASGQASDAAGPEPGAGPGDAARAAAPEAAGGSGAGGSGTGETGTGETGTGPALAVPVPGPSPVPPPVGTPLGPGTGECADRQDPALRALVDQALPEVVGAPEAATTLECRPGGERGVALELPGGLLTVTYLPPGPVTEPPDGARTAPTASGGTVVVASRAGRAGEAAPLVDRLDAAVAYLAPRL